MTEGRHSQAQDGRGRLDGPVSVVVVAADAARLEQYDAAFGAVEAPTLTTHDPDEAEKLLSEQSPHVLVLDHGLPRLVLFRLYRLVREDESDPPTQVVFVGQDGEAGPGDHYLPGDDAPSTVAVHVASLVAAEREDAAGSPPPPGGSAASANGQAADIVVSTPAGPATATTAPPSDASATAAEAEATPAPQPGRRLDVILVRVGLVLFIIGGFLILLQVQASQAPLIAPTVVPVTPTRRPEASPGPSPAARLDAPSPSAPDWLETV